MRPSRGLDARSAAFPFPFPEPGKVRPVRISFLGIVYLVGVVVAALNDYFDKLNTVKQVGEAVIAVVVWPLILLGVDINLK